MSGRANGFASSLGYALFAALATLPIVLIAAPIIGARPTLVLGSMLLGAGYLLAIAPGWSRGVRLAVAALGLGIVIAVAAPTTGAAILAAICVLGVLRSGFLYRSRPMRALLIETGLLSAGLLLAGILTNPAVSAGYSSFALRCGLGVWGFFLVQSLFFVIGGVTVRAEEPEGVDPFVKAREEAIRLMEDPTG